VPHSIDVTDASFQAQVIDASHRVPVIVDFWAPWCGPCRALKPILEKLAAENEGRFILAKLNTDENPETASRFGIRSIPAVKAFKDGTVAREFLGAIPESSARAFLRELMPSPGEVLRASALTALADGDFEMAEARLREALTQEPGLHAARLDLTELLIARQAWSEAELTLAALPEHERDERAAKLVSRVALWKASQSLPSAQELVAALARVPADLNLRLQLAERHAADGEFEAALEQLLEVIRKDRGALRESARKAMLDVFSLAAGDAELVARFRRLLASALH
jgi:putative thioredoxin